MSASITTDSHSSASASGSPHIKWTMPATTEARSVLPDRYTDMAQFDDSAAKGKETDPSRMGIFVCLLDERPHLHPNLAALHKHRLVVHSIPSPTNPAHDLPVPRDENGGEEWLTWKLTEEEEQRRKAYLPLA